MLGTFPSAFFPTVNSLFSKVTVEFPKRQLYKFMLAATLGPQPVLTNPSRPQFPLGKLSFGKTPWENAKHQKNKSFVISNLSKRILKLSLNSLCLLGHIVLHIIFSVSVQTPALSLYLHQSIQINTRSVMDSILSLSAVLRQETCFYIHIFIYIVFHNIGIIIGVS